MVPSGSQVVNSLYRQRTAIENFLKACIGLPPNTNMALEQRVSILKTILPWPLAIKDFLTVSIAFVAISLKIFSENELWTNERRSEALQIQIGMIYTIIFMEECEFMNII